MNKFRLFRSAEINDLSEDCLKIFALGYESRATNTLNFFDSSIKNGIALGFEKQQCHSWEKNREKFESSSVVVDVIGDSEFFEVAKGHILNYVRTASSKHSVFVDISSFSRFRLGCLIELFLKHLPEDSTIVFAYTIAEFTAPANDTVPITKVAPINRFFSGLPIPPEKRLMAIIGLGYDQDRALGALEYLEISQATLFKPDGSNDNYSLSLAKANSQLIESFQSSIVEYPIESPITIYSKLSSYVQSCLVSERPIIIPLGSKIFALVALLLAANNFPNLPVWHVSSNSDNAVDRPATNKTVLLRADVVHVKN